MGVVFLVIGFALIIVAVSDLLVNTLVLNGAGKISKHISSYVWQFLWHIAGKNGRSRVLSYSNIFIIAAMFLYYLVFIWAGVWLIYMAVPDSVISSSTKLPANWLEKLYFSGYVLSTMGLGDFNPNYESYKIITSIFSLLGLSVMTLFITYIIPVASAGVQKESLGNFIGGMGRTPSEIIERGYNAERKSIYKDQFADLYQKLLQHTKSHLAYPILHYYHDTTPKHSFIINLVKLDEVLHTIKFAVSKDVIDQRNIDLLIFAIDNYMAIVKAQSNLFLAPDEPAPPLERFGKDHLPLELNKPDKETMERWNKRRMEWQRMLYFEGWDFSHVYSDEEENNNEG